MMHVFHVPGVTRDQIAFAAWREVHLPGQQCQGYGAGDALRGPQICPGEGQGVHRKVGENYWISLVHDNPHIHLPVHGKKDKWLGLT